MNQNHLQSCVLPVSSPHMALPPPTGIHPLVIGTYIPFYIFMLSSARECYSSRFIFLTCIKAKMLKH